MQRSRTGAPAALAIRSPVHPRLTRRAFARRALAPLVLPLAALSLLGGCTPPTSTPRTTDAAATPTLVPGMTASPGTQPTDAPIASPRPGQVDTPWGPIWEIVPVDFPILAGAQPAEADAVVSAAYTIPTSSFGNARAVADEYGRLFESAGYAGSVDGPLEDGSSTTSASNGDGCDLLVTALPRGSEEIYVTVLYGALCPLEWQQ